MAKSILTEIFESEYANFKRYLKGRFNRMSEYDVEDVIQQTVLKILYKGNDALSIKNMTSYMYTSLRNGAIDHMKKRKYEVLGDEYLDGETDTVEQTVLNEEMKEVLKAAIDSLDEKSKYIFIETEIMGRSYKDLSNETGEKLGTLLSRKSRALKKLSHLIVEYMDKETKQ